MIKKVSHMLIVALLGASFHAQAKDWPAPIKALEAQGIEVIGSFEPKNRT